jgi:geranylgeranyl transferase type-2 subunit beta
MGWLFRHRMPSYLQDLTLRLASGMGQLSGEVRQLHARFLKARQNADGGFAGREGGSDLYYTSFALRSLAISGELHGDVAVRAARFLSTRLGGQAAIIDFLSLLYSAMLLESAAGIDVLANVPADWRTRVAAELERFRREDGGYAMSHEGHSSSTYYTFLMLLCQQLMDVPPVEPERLVQFVRSRQRDDGGFVEMGPMKRSGTNPTAAAIGTLKILNAIDDGIRDGAIDFLAGRQTDEGGLAANTRIPFADVLSSFTGTLTLMDLGGLAEIDAGALQRFVEGLQFPQGGFLAHAIDETPDVEYTFYGLGALALLKGQ